MQIKHAGQFEWRPAGYDMGAFDYAWTEAGEEHDLIAVEDAVVYVASEKPIHAVAEPA